MPAESVRTVEDLEQALDASLKARERLLASISHDLRNPLNTFAMSAGLLRDDLERGDVDAARALSLLGRMERGIERMQRLIDDLHEASLVEAKAIAIHRGAVKSTIVIEDVVKACAPLVQERSVKLETDAVDERTVDADRARIVQALAKLVAFAVRSTGEGGSIRLLAEPGEGTVTFGVSALGPRGTPLRLEPGKGSLALVIARGIVDAHGATLDDRSDATLRWTFTLPAT